MREATYTKSEGGRIPVPDFVLEVMTREEFNSLHPSMRHRIRQKGTTKSLRFGREVLPVPQFLRDKYTKEEWGNLDRYKRHSLSHPAKAEKDKNQHRVKRFEDIEKYDRQQLSSKLQRVFNITIEQYDDLLVAQNYMCAICKQPERVTYKKEVAEGEYVNTPRRLAVDHEHETGIIRGLLCFDCNKRLHSKNGEGLSWIKQAAKYLESDN
jgi:hypothetical protein